MTVNLHKGSVSHEISRTDVNEECDEMFLLWSTAEHIGTRPTDQEVREHAADCDECMHNGNADL